jgi:hypothetical protein
MKMANQSISLIQIHIFQHAKSIKQIRLKVNILFIYNTLNRSAQLRQHPAKANVIGS